MRYFTRELYEKLQVSGYLVYFENEEEIEEQKQYYIEDGMDYDEISKRNYDQLKPYLLKHLPPTLHESIKDYSIINSKIPPKELLLKLNKWNDNIDNEWAENREKYFIYYNQIKNKLPKRIQRIGDKYSFHDAEITAVRRPNLNRLIIDLDCSGCYKDFGHCSLYFNNIKFQQIPDNIIGNWWLYHEIHASETGNIDLQVLLYIRDSDDVIPLNEIRIIANEFFVKWRQNT